MTPFPHTPAWRALAARINWFRSPDEALDHPFELLAYAMRQGTMSDLKILLAHIGREGLREAIIHAPPGIIDARSWSFWNLVAGFTPQRPLPKRTFGL